MEAKQDTEADPRELPWGESGNRNVIALLNTLADEESHPGNRFFSYRLYAGFS
jgi:hypothetical protein